MTSKGVKGTMVFQIKSYSGESFEVKAISTHKAANQAARKLAGRKGLKARRLTGDMGMNGTFIAYEPRLGYEEIPVGESFSVQMVKEKPMKVKEQQLLTVQINYEDIKITKANYVTGKTKDLQEYGYPTLTEDTVREQLDLVLQGAEDGITVIGRFIEGDKPRLAS